MVVYLIFISAKKDKHPLMLYWMTETPNCYTLLKAMVEKSGQYEFYGHKTKPDYEGFHEDAGQFLLAQKGDTSGLDIPKRLEEISEIADSLIAHNLMDKSLMGPQMKRRLSELRAEEKVLEENGKRPTAARYKRS